MQVGHVTQRGQLRIDVDLTAFGVSVWPKFVQLRVGKASAQQPLNSPRLRVSSTACSQRKPPQSVCHLVKTGLVSLGVDTITANTGDDALARFNGSDVDVVLTDVRMRPPASNSATASPRVIPT
jgi:hypothetical protein